jgi:hypothetical protein
MEYFILFLCVKFGVSFFSSILNIRQFNTGNFASVRKKNRASLTMPVCRLSNFFTGNSTACV